MARVAVLVAGMHRSGTSALTQLLVGLGCDAPKTLMPADDYNAKGYWESTEIAALNNDILSSAGSSWDSWERFGTHWYASPAVDDFRDRAQMILANEFGDSVLFVLKDPRICRLMPFWLAAIENFGATPQVILPLRNPLEVAASLAERDAIELPFGLLMWLRNVLDAEAESRQCSRTFLRYEELLVDWRDTVARMGRDLGIAWPRQSSAAALEVDADLSPTLRHHVESDSRVVGSRSSRWVATTYDILQRWAGGEVRDTDVEQIDAINAMLTESAQVFAHPVAAGMRAGQTNRKLETDIGDLNKTVDELNKIVAARDDHIQSLKQAVRGRDEVIADKDGHIANLDNAIADRDVRVDAQIHAVADRDGRIGALNDAVHNRDEQITALQRVAADRDGQIDALQHAIASRNDLIDALQHAADNKDDRIADQDSQIANLGNVIADRDVRIDAQIHAIADRDVRIDAQIHAIADRDVRIDAQIHAIADRDGRIGALNDAVHNRDEQITALQRAVADRDGQIDALQHAVDNKDNRIADRDGQLDILQRAVASRNDLIDALQLAVDNKDDQIADQDGQIANLGNAIADRDVRIDAQIHAVADRDGRIGALNDAVHNRDDQITALQRTVADRDGQIDALQLAADNKDDQIADRDGRIVSFEQSLRDREAQIEALCRSTSWRITAPLRLAHVIAAKCVRLPFELVAFAIFYIARLLWRLVPLGRSRRPRWRQSVLRTLPERLAARFGPAAVRAGRGYVSSGRLDLSDLNSEAARNQGPIPILFDPDYYLANNADVKVAGVDPLTHYLEYGAIERRLPIDINPKDIDPVVLGLHRFDSSQAEPLVFDVEFYRAIHPDLASLDDAALAEHYQRHGKTEGRVATKAEFLREVCGSPREIPIDFHAAQYISLYPDLHDYADKSPLEALRHYMLFGRWEPRLHTLRGDAKQVVRKPSIDLDLPTVVPRSRPLCVLAHVYYADLWDEISEYIDNLPDDIYDLYVNLVDTTFDQQLLAKVRGDFPLARIYISENAGRDIGGYLRVLHNVRMEDYRIFCLVHTKKSPHMSKGEVQLWRRKLLEPLMGSPDMAAENIQLMLSDNKIGLLGADRCRYAELNDNPGKYFELLQRLGINEGEEDVEFLSGTMMFLRREVLQRLYEATEGIMFEPGDDQPTAFHRDGQWAHAVERAFGAVVRDMNYRFEWR